jgi:hypothetical protein
MDDRKRPGHAVNQDVHETAEHRAKNKRENRMDDIHRSGGNVRIHVIRGERVKAFMEVADAFADHLLDLGITAVVDARHGQDGFLHAGDRGRKDHLLFGQVDENIRVVDRFIPVVVDEDAVPRIDQEFDQSVEHVLDPFHGLHAFRSGQYFGPEFAHHAFYVVYIVGHGFIHGFKLLVLHKVIILRLFLLSTKEKGGIAPPFFIKLLLSLLFLDLLCYLLFDFLFLRHATRGHGSSFMLYYNNYSLIVK